MTGDLDARRKRILYRASYRGFKEADLVIGGFAKAYIAELSEDDLDAFEALLEQNDRELYAWVRGEGDHRRGLRSQCSNNCAGSKSANVPPWAKREGR
ncbi:MAG: succinate dehydrogenase assembly factor 2 [Parvularculaceae bacterium]